MRASMKRTTVMLSADLRRRAFRRAKEKGVSFGAVVRDSLDAALPASDEVSGGDSLFADGAVWGGRAPRALAREHDRFLYGSEP
jgi:hypothetical protein